jgi:hypothetical protein
MKPFPTCSTELSEIRPLLGRRFSQIELDQKNYGDSDSHLYSDLC